VSKRKKKPTRKKGKAKRSEQEPQKSTIQRGQLRTNAVEHEAAQGLDAPKVIVGEGGRKAQKRADPEDMGGNHSVQKRQSKREGKRGAETPCKQV